MPWKEPGKNCWACKHSYMEPSDMNLVCGLPELGTFGKYVKGEFGEHCNGGKKFEQHPGRNPDGTLKSS